MSVSLPGDPQQERPPAPPCPERAPDPALRWAFLSRPCLFPLRCSGRQHRVDQDATIVSCRYHGSLLPLRRQAPELCFEITIFLQGRCPGPLPQRRPSPASPSGGVGRGACRHGGGGRGTSWPRNFREQPRPRGSDRAPPPPAGSPPSLVEYRVGFGSKPALAPGPRPRYGGAFRHPVAATALRNMPDVPGCSQSSAEAGPSSADPRGQRSVLGSACVLCLSLMASKRLKAGFP
jgi:hypothetical protein